MNYQVLARKWRPKNFSQLMGQEHVVTVLVNALTQSRLHHAYLFTGTRGVGKTTIARIFAKSLNCEQGITAEPCGKCDTCVDIDQGRFIDLLEIDAASKTKVDDTRELLDNVQYAPTRGRFKVYLIDEVHMLSRHSFNALLKTLEEPPEHVKFILATTDPQKLPVTVLSRCLQFHLKALTVNQIETKLTEIMLAEEVKHDPGSLTLLAKAARGSMRDSLSLTDQAIAQGEGTITLSNIQKMLGSIDQGWLYQIVIALLKQDGKLLLELSKNIASFAPSYSQIFAELIQLFHQIALMQVIEQHFDLPTEHVELLKKFSQALSPEDVQLYYQICLNGRKDLPYAFDEQAAFDMTLLRLLAFKPMRKSQTQVNSATEVEQHFDNIELPQPPLLQNTTEIMPEQESAVEVSKGLEQREISNKSSTLPNENLQEKERAESLLENDNTIATSELEQQALTAQMQQIEQQASELHADQEVNEQFNAHSDIPVPIQDENLAINAVLSTRNMLRSRKKGLDGETKKFDGAALRQKNIPNETISDNRNDNFEETTVPVEVSQVENNINQDEVNNSSPSVEQTYQADNIDPAIIKHANQVDKWAHMIDAMGLNGRIRQLAIHATVSENSTDNHLILRLDQITKHLNTQTAQEQIQQFISEYLKKTVTVTIELVEKTIADPYKIQSDINDKRYDYAKKLLKEDEIVIALQENFQATIDEQSVSAR